MTLCPSHAALQSDLCGGISVSRPAPWCPENLQDSFDVKNMKTQACMPCCALTNMFVALFPLGPTGAWCLASREGLRQGWHTRFLEHLLFPGGFCSLPCFIGQRCPSSALVLYLAPPVCLITWACAEEEGFGKEMGIVQSHMAKASQETKKQPCLLSKGCCPSHPCCAGPGGHKFKQNGLFITDCSGESPEALQSELCHEMLLQGVSW